MRKKSDGLIMAELLGITSDGYDASWKCCECGHLVIDHDKDGCTDAFTADDGDDQPCHCKVPGDDDDH